MPVGMHFPKEVRHESRAANVSVRRAIFTSHNWNIMMNFGLRLLWLAWCHNSVNCVDTNIYTHTHICKRRIYLCVKRIYTHKLSHVCICNLQYFIDGHFSSDGMHSHAHKCSYWQIESISVDIVASSYFHFVNACIVACIAVSVQRLHYCRCCCASTISHVTAFVCVLILQ